MPQLSAVAPRRSSASSQSGRSAQSDGAHPPKGHRATLDPATIERTAQVAITLATQVAPLALRLLRRSRRQRDIETAALESETEDAPPSALERTTGRLARAVNSLGATIYDYSNGQYGIKPLDPNELRRARKETEKLARQQSRERAREQARANAREAKKRRRGGAAWPLVVLGALLAGGSIALIILQREQVRAAVIQARERGRTLRRQAERQLRGDGPIIWDDVLAADAMNTPTATPSS